MAWFLRFMAFFLKCIGSLLEPFAYLLNINKRKKIPPIRNELLKLAVIDLAEKIRQKEVTSEEVVKAYIERVREVNPIINAVVEDRFADAIEDAKRADQIIATKPLQEIAQNYPILGVPFTVKESCSLKGMSYSVGSLTRKGYLAPSDGETVSNIKAFGGIPLLVSNTPEFCTSWESINKITGRTKNPYDTRRTAGGSSGGEGALIGSGASPFGIGSDIAGSIRVPAMFCGIFGHKPTGGFLSVSGHFPTSVDENFSTYLVVGPMCRHAKDLPTLLHVFSGGKTEKLRLHEPLYTKDIKIYYKEDNGFSLVDVPVDKEIKHCIRRAVEHFRSNGLLVKESPITTFQPLVEGGLAKLFSMKDIPLILRHPDNPKKVDNVYVELIKSLFRQSKYTFAGLYFCFLYFTNGFIPKRDIPKYNAQFDAIKEELIKLLGDDGVLLYPTYPTIAPLHNQTFPKMAGVIYPMNFNLMGFPATHVPIGRNREGIPLGFQVVAAPNQDRLCFCIARELDAAFGGWTEPS